MSRNVHSEFPRPLEVDHIPIGGCTEYLVADAKELVAIARRLDLPKLHALRARLSLDKLREGGVTVEGELAADLEQTCVVTLDDFRSSVTFAVRRIFLRPKDIPVDESAEADADPIIEGQIDLGELVVEILSLNLDAYPRRPGARFDDANVEQEEIASPFAELGKLKSAGG